MPAKKAPGKPISRSSAKPKPTSKTSAEPQPPADVVDAQLARYRSMRHFDVTSEPAGDTQAGSAARNQFCIQKHAATRLHYDFRLGWNGVLKSWACAKGPSYTVADKRLAVQVEDHPMEYGGFEGIIPAGQYGGGTVMLWDQGTWAPQAGYEDVDAGLRDGHLKFTMDGTKMHGKWALIRMGGRAAQEKKPNWLLIKEHDEFERPPSGPAVTDAEPNSVVTGRSLEEIASAEDHVWNSKETQSGPQAWFRQDSKSKTPANKAGASSKTKAEEVSASSTITFDLNSLPKENQPTFLKPQLAQETQAPPDGPAWIHELKLDGYRMQARKDGAKVQMLTRSGLDWTERVRAVAAEVARLPVERITLDGEVVVLADDGTTNFADLQASFQEGARNPLTFFCFDLLHVEGRSSRGLPLVERKKLLAQILLAANAETLQMSEHLTSNGVEMFHKACELHAEGIVSKRGDAPYAGGRSSAWLKAKCLHEQEFVVGGYTLPGKGKAGGPGLGALLLGYYDEQQRLIYAGRTGTGFTQKGAALLRKQLETMTVKSAAYSPASLTTDARRSAIWVAPTMVVQVRFATWTADEQVRQAAFLGVREDKAAKDVRRETAAPTPKAGKSSKAAIAVRPDDKASAGSSDALAHPPVRLTHPQKILDPASKLTKQQLADFYWAVSEKMLPHLSGRALSIVRVPEGIDKEHFYQKHVTHMLPPGFDAVDVPDKKTGKIEKYISLSTREAIPSLAQISVLEVHPWGSLASDLERPDRLTIDLDPDESLPWSTLSSAAKDVRKHLKKLGLESWVKTTGGKGLHVVIPITPDLAWPEIKAFCHAFVRTVERSNSALYLTVMTKAARTNKIYLDYLRNERGATAVAPYSPRARANAGVAVPLAWSELDAPERPVFNIGNFPRWQSRLKKDPWTKFMDIIQPVTSEARRAVGLK